MRHLSVGGSEAPSRRGDAGMERSEAEEAPWIRHGSPSPSLPPPRLPLGASPSPAARPDAVACEQSPTSGPAFRLTPPRAPPHPTLPCSPALLLLAGALMLILPTKARPARGRDLGPQRARPLPASPLFSRDRPH